MEAGGGSEMVVKSVGLRKGAWSQDEDKLLRRCVVTFGEGRWHQVPLRAGLNRCRKSCRLRWLNYLKPNIKRGEFSNDEINLMARLHKLLGNRWALIAGRLPGRTANDVKNYWNTHQKKLVTKTFRFKPEHIIHHNSSSKVRSMQITKTNIIKPRPWTFSSKSFTWARKTTTETPNPIIVTNKPLVVINSDESIKRGDDHHTSSGEGEISTWVDSLKRLLDDDVGVNDNDNEKQPVEPTSNDDYDSSLWTDIDIQHLLGDYSGNLI